MPKPKKEKMTVMHREQRQLNELPKEILIEQLHALAAAQQQFNAGLVKLIARDQQDRPICAFIYVRTDPADVQAVIDAVEAVEASWK